MAELQQNDLKDKNLSENFSLVQAFGEYIVNQMQEGDDKSVFLVYTEGEKTACVVGGKLESISTAIYNGIKQNEVISEIIKPITQQMVYNKLNSIVEKFNMKKDGGTEY